MRPQCHGTIIALRHAAVTRRGPLAAFWTQGGGVTRRESVAPTYLRSPRARAPEEAPTCSRACFGDVVVTLPTGAARRAIGRSGGADALQALPATAGARGSGWRSDDPRSTERRAARSEALRPRLRVVRRHTLGGTPSASCRRCCCYGACHRGGSCHYQDSGALHQTRQRVPSRRCHV